MRYDKYNSQNVNVNAKSQLSRLTRLQDTHAGIINVLIVLINVKINTFLDIMVPLLYFLKVMQGLSSEVEFF